MLATSHSSAQSGSNMSQNSVSPLHSAGPLTPPETSQGGLAIQSPSTPPMTTGRSPRPTRKSARPSPMPRAYPQPGPYDHMSPQAVTPANLMPPPSSYSPAQSYGTSPYNLMASPLGYPSPLGTASPSHFSSYPTSFPTSGYFPSQPMTYSLSQQSSQSSKPFQSESEAEAEGETDYETISFAVDLDLDHESSKCTKAKASSSKSPKDVAIPRPANAWILYRSDRLKDISAGRKIKGLDAVMREAGYSASSASASSGDASGLDQTQRTTPATSVSATDEDQVKPKAKKIRKAKKGAKEPTEGLLSLGKGKSGRGLPQAHISKMISILWKRESADVRSKYEQLSEQRKQEHLEKYPDYKYQPVKRADKIRIKDLKEMEKEKEKETIKFEKQREKEIRRAATREPGVQKQRSRPSTAPYNHEPRQGLNRSKSTQALQQQQFGSPQKSRKSAAPSSRVDPGQLYEYQPFPFSVGYQPNAPADYETYQMPLASSSAEQSRLNSRQHSPSKPSTAQMPMPPSLHPGTPAPYPVHPGIAPVTGPIDPALYGQYAEQQMPPPQLQHPQPQYVQPRQPFYADMTGLGPVYAQPVVFEPQSVPDSMTLESLYPAYDATAETPEDRLIQQWVVMEEMEDEPGEGSSAWPQDPETTASDWANLSGDTQEQFFQDLDLSHAMAVQLVPEIGMTPFDFTNEGYMTDALQPTIDYDAGYLNMPFYTQQPSLQPSPQLESGPFLSVQQRMSPDPRDITPRQSHFAQNMVNTLDDTSGAVDFSRVASTSNNNPVMTSRYVSASAFPDTPLSVDPSGLGGLDRRISYAAGDLEWQNDTDTDTDTDTDYEALSHSHHSNDEVNVKSERASPTKLDLPLSPSEANDFEPGSSTTSSSASSPSKPGVPRVGAGRRARSVASSFT